MTDTSAFRQSTISQIPAGGARFKSRVSWLSPKPMFEEQALAALAQGEVDFALVTVAVTEPPGRQWQAHWQADALGSTTM